jgi:FkbM family methyltransferase
MIIKRKIGSVIRYLNVFLTPFDVVKFRKLYKDTTSEPNSLTSLRVKETKNHPLFCRPNTTDAQVLWDTFSRKYHLPPIDLDEDAVIVDLGSNVGYTMAHFAYLYPKSHIFGVEINSGNFEMAKKNLATLKDQCVIIHAAIWSENGMVSYGGNAEWGYSIVRERDHNSNIEHQVLAKTLDTIFQEYNLKKIDYLKMDIEGAEKFVLQNPEKWIKFVRSMKIEIHPPATFEECEEMLKRNGFSCTRDKLSTLPCIIAIKN